MVSAAAMLICTLAVLSPRVSALADLAWNGHTTQHSLVPAPFTPYYVPPGAKAYDSSSPLIHYSKGWEEAFSTAHVGNSFRQTHNLGSYLFFTFNGTGIEGFGPCDKFQGIAAVYIDGKLARRVSGACASDKRLPQQRIFWFFDLTPGKHTLKLVNTAVPAGHSRSILSFDAFVVTLGPDRQPSTVPSNFGASLPPGALQAERWTLEQKGSTGVHAMQLVVVSPTHALIIDKVEHNPVSIDGHPAWAALYNLDDHSVMPMSIQSNSFCAGGTFLSNGTLINVGGNPVVEDKTAAADFGDVDGLQAIRLFHPCSADPENCAIYENHQRIRMASPRWYTTVLRLYDGSAMILGGSKKGLPISLPFLQDTLNANLFPIAFSLPNGKIFIAANTQAVIYDWTNNKERRLPPIPNGVRVTYPMTATAVLLPLSPLNHYMPEVLICGGSNISDTRAGYDISSQEPASEQCVRMTLSDEGIAKGWEVEWMPDARLMPDAVLLPTGKVLIVNGARTGISGYGNVRNQTGQSNADNPVLKPVLYDPYAPSGSRFSDQGIPASNIPRLYHSVATLTPRGSIMIAGSNPNLDRSALKYGTEYRVEWLRPPYMTMSRPQIVKGPKQIDFEETTTLTVKLPPGSPSNVKDVQWRSWILVLSHTPVHANSRLVYLNCKLSADGSELSVVGPPNAMVYPPGPGWIFVVVDDAASEALHVMIGNGKGPDVDAAAMNNVLDNTKADQHEQVKSGDEE
ncbi:copper radical oxidase [Mycena amicta]|nr:copper radical oxidase [Mycena amicta]